MRTSKYLNKTFDNGWKCTHVGIANVSSKFYKGTKLPTKYPGHRNYYYIFERRTSDNKADKMIRLEAPTAAKVYRGEVKIEDLVSCRESVNENAFTRKVSYHFTDRF